MYLQPNHSDRGTWKTQITLDGVPMYITEEYLGVFFSDYGAVGEVSSVRSKAGIVTSDYKHMVTLTHKKFTEVPMYPLVADGISL